MVVVYIVRKQIIADIKEFLELYRSTQFMDLKCTEFGENYDQLSLILAGNFIIDFKDDESKSFKKFLIDRFNLRKNNNPA